MIELANGRMVNSLSEMHDDEFVIIKLPEGGIICDSNGNITQHIEAGVYKVSKKDVFGEWAKIVTKNWRATWNLENY